MYETGVRGDDPKEAAKWYRLAAEQGHVEAQTRLGVRRQLSEHNVDDAMARFERYERKMDDLEGQVEAYDMGQRTLADEIADLEKDETIDAELEQLKARLSGAPPAAPAGTPHNAS